MPQARGTKVRSTRQAAAVVAVMSGMPAFGGARDIYNALRRDGERVGLATVYRHLRVLAEQGSVDTIRTASGETLYRLRGSNATHHLTCRACGRCVEVDGSEVWEWARRVAARAGFTITGHTVELTGLCAAHAGG
jgi:Fur family transcriptional regulator, ferric uptake regulator